MLSAVSGLFPFYVPLGATAAALPKWGFLAPCGKPHLLLKTAVGGWVFKTDLDPLEPKKTELDRQDRALTAAACLSRCQGPCAKATLPLSRSTNILPGTASTSAGYPIPPRGREEQRGRRHQHPRASKRGSNKIPRRAASTSFWFSVLSGGPCSPCYRDLDLG